MATRVCIDVDLTVVDPDGNLLQVAGEFTNSRGLVAVHPVADFVAANSRLLAWLLRWEAFRRFEYDPDNIFSRT